MLEKLMQSPIAWAILSIITIISLPIAIYSIMTSRKKKEISYIGRSYCIVEKGKKKLENLQITYKDRVIDNLTITQYAIWNSGNQLLNREDIVTDPPLRLIAKNRAQLLEGHIVAESEVSNKFSISEFENSIYVDFDYVAENEGIVLQVIHTGQRKDLSFECKIKGGKPLKCRNAQSMKSKRLSILQPKKITRVRIMIAFIGIITIAMFLFGVISLLSGFGIIPANNFIRYILYQKVDVSQIEQVSLGILMLTMSLLYSYVIGYSAMNILRIGIPAKLRTYSDNEYFD